MIMARDMKTAMSLNAKSLVPLHTTSMLRPNEIRLMMQNFRK
jgi:hypothetical protein